MANLNAEYWAGHNVLVTGGASFIGSHLVERLVWAGAKVRVADNLSSGKTENLIQVAGDVDLRVGDLLDPSFATEASRGVDTVFHLAADHGGRGYIDTHPVECTTNMILDGNVFRAAHRAGVERVSFASSACVYPVHLQELPHDGNMVYLKEEWANPFVRNAASSDGEYGWAKLMAEMALSAYHRQYGMKTSSCRFFTVYGERENETHAVVALIAKAYVRMDPYEIWGTGQQDRNFTYVADIADGMLRAAAEITDGSAINIGTDEHVKIIDCAEAIFRHMNWRPQELFFDTSKPVGVFSRAADLTRMRERLGWTPQTSFQTGLERTINWYCRTYSAPLVAVKLQLALTER